MEETYEIWKDGVVLNTIVSDYAFVVKYAKSVGGSAKWVPPSEVQELQESSSDTDDAVADISSIYTDRINDLETAIIELTELIAGGK